MRRLIFLVLLAALFFSLGCISDEQEKKPQNVTTLRIGYQPMAHQVAAMVAQAKGWWLEDLKPFGVKEVKTFPFPFGGPEIKSMGSGDLDVIYICASPTIAPISHGLDAKIVAAVDTNGSNLVFRNGVNFNGAQSLKGLRIATYPRGTAQDVLLKMWLADNGVNISSVNLTAMAPGDAVNAILEGKVDGVFAPTPAQALIELAGKGKTVLTSGEMFPKHACCVVVVSGKLIRENPALVEQIVKTHINATRFVIDNPAETARIYANMTGQDLKMIEYAMNTTDISYITDPNLIINSTLALAKFQHELNYTQKELTKEDLFDTSFYDRASKGG